MFITRQSDELTLLKITASQRANTTMLKLVNGFADLCIPYSTNQDELLETLNEAIDGEIFFGINVFK